MVNKIPNVNIPLIPPDMGKIGKIVVDDTKKLGERVSGAFNDGLGGKYVGKDGVLTKGMQDATNRTKALADNVGKLGDKLLGSASNAIPAWKELKALLASQGDTDFDIRSVLGKKDSKSDVDVAVNGINEKLKAVKPIKIKAVKTKQLKTALTDTQKLIQDIGGSISQSFNQNFKGLIKGTQSFKTSMLNILDTILDKMLDVILNPIFDSIGGSISKGITSFLSFDGGGFTGKGVRAGGMDNKGGKLAMLHPNETVVDHTKGGVPFPSRGGGGTVVHMPVVNNFNGVTREEVMKDMDESQSRLKKLIDSESPSRIREYQKNSERGMA